MKAWKYTSLLFAALAAPALAVDEPDQPSVLVQVNVAELGYLNSQVPLPDLFLDVEDAVDHRHLRFDLGASLRLLAENFDPVTGNFIDSRPVYRDPGEVEFILPADFTPGNTRIYTEDSRRRQEPVNFDVRVHAKGEVVQRSHALLDGASTLSVIRQTGAAANRLDFVLIGDGYTRAQEAQWISDAQLTIDNFFNEPPYDNYRSYFNLYRVDAYSLESGADHPAAGTTKDTAFDATYECSGIPRLVCVSVSKVRTEISKHLAANAMDIILVVVNDTEYGGSGGSLAVVSRNSAALDVAHHELGHSFGRLTDEYVDTGVVPAESCNPNVEPSAQNASKLYSDRASIDWAHWIDAGTPIPTVFTSGTSGTPGLYAGGAYCANLYRPTPNSKMRSLGRPFEAINEEQLVLSMYDYVSVLESVTPAAGTINMNSSNVTQFTFQALHPVTTDVVSRWYLDGVQVATGTSVPAAQAPLGRHTLELIVSDPTTKVRKDPLNKLSERTVWTLVRDSGATFANQVVTLPVVRLPTGQAYAVTLKLVASSPSMIFELATLQPITTAQADTDATYNAGILMVPGVNVNGNIYRARLEAMPNASPLRLVVTQALLL